MKQAVETVSMRENGSNETTQVFYSADYAANVNKRTLGHKVSFVRKPKVELIEQLITDPRKCEAPILISRLDHTLVISNFEGELICKLSGHKHKVTAIKALSANIVVSGDASGELIIWDITQLPGENSTNNKKEKKQLRAKHLLKKLHEHQHAITAIEAISATVFISASLDGRYKYWQIDKNESLQTMVSDKSRPILALTALSDEEVLYCTENPHVGNDVRIFMSYNIVRCNRFHHIHKIVNTPEFSCSLFSGTIEQIRLTPDQQLTFLVQSRLGNSVLSGNGLLKLPEDTPAKLLANGRYAFWDGKNHNMVINQYPIIELKAKI